MSDIYEITVLIGPMEESEAEAALDDLTAYVYGQTWRPNGAPGVSMRRTYLELADELSDELLDKAWAIMETR